MIVLCESILDGADGLFNHLEELVFISLDETFHRLQDLTFTAVA